MFLEKNSGSKFMKKPQKFHFFGSPLSKSDVKLRLRLNLRLKPKPKPKVKPKFKFRLRLKAQA